MNKNDIQMWLLRSKRHYPATQEGKADMIFDCFNDLAPKIKVDAVLGLMDTDCTCETPNGNSAWSSNAIEEYAAKLEGGE